MRICDHCREFSDGAVAQYTEVKLEVRGATYVVDLCWDCVSSGQEGKMDFGKAVMHAAMVVDTWVKQYADVE